METSLKPCPFCGGTLISRVDLIDGSSNYHVCGTCWATGPRAKGYAAAAQGWNARVGSAALHVERIPTPRPTPPDPRGRCPSCSAKSDAPGWEHGWLCPSAARYWMHKAPRELWGSRLWGWLRTRTTRAASVTRRWRCRTCREVYSAQVTHHGVHVYDCRGCGARNAVDWSKR